MGFKIDFHCSALISFSFFCKLCFLLVKPIFLLDLISAPFCKRLWFLTLDFLRRSLPFLPLWSCCLQRLNNSPNCPNSLVAHQIHFVLPWASPSTNHSARRQAQPITAREAADLTNQRLRCHLPTQTAAISLKLV